MRRRLLSITPLTIILMGMLTLMSDFKQVRSEIRIIVVPDNYATIQAAINAANPGDTIFVKNRTYYEHVVMNKTVSLVGQNRETTILDGGGIGNVTEVTADNVTVTGFTIRNAEAWAGSGIALSQVTNCNVFGNNIQANNCSDGIWLHSSSNNGITGNNITNNWDGISLWNSSCNNITGNNIKANDHYGIMNSGSSNNDSITGNNIEDNDYGIVFWHSSHNKVVGNNIANNSNGIWLWNLSHENSITGNSIKANRVDGIMVSLSSKNTSITGNNITGNMGKGISLCCLSSNSTVTGNNIANNYYAIWLYYTSNNSVFHNNFVENQDAYIFESYGDSWDNGHPSGGNYWSNYTGTDADHDGIGDTPYIVYADSIDNYPLMGIFSDFNATPEYHIQTICNSSISDFTFNGTAISFNVSGKDGTTGFCRIGVPTALMNGTYEVFVNDIEVQYNLLPHSDGKDNYLYFTYDHSTKKVLITPEFSSLLIAPLFMIATLLAVIVYRRKRSQ